MIFYIFDVVKRACALIRVCPSIVASADLPYIRRLTDVIMAKERADGELSAMAK